MDRVGACPTTYDSKQDNIDPLEDTNTMGGFRIFSLAGIPVHVSIWYLLLSGWIGFRSENPLLWITTLTVSILVHEFGHAFASRHYDLNPQILLHGWGGLCSHERAERDLHDVVIISAGPGAGFVLGGLTFAFSLALQWFAPDWLAAQPLVELGIQYMLFINIIWSFVNLIPLWPLDGGQLFRLGMVRLFGGAKGEKITHYTGIGLSIIAALLAFKFFSGFFMALLCGFLAWENYKRLQSGGSGPVRRVNKTSAKLVAQAQQALHNEDFREAARLTHLARDEKGRIPEKVMTQIWTILSIATAQQGDYEEALSYIKRAPASPEVIEAQAWCLTFLERRDEVQTLLDSDRGKILPTAVRNAVLQEIGS